MCHLCRKVEILRGFDSKATKLILIALQKLHRHVEPRVGGLWLWRNEETIKLRGLLGRLHRIVPAKALEAIIAEVDQDLVHIKKNMADHPPRQNTGPENVFAASITVDQSSSVRMKKEQQQERESRQSDSKVRGLASSGGISKSSAGRDLPDLPGSDIHPPSVRIRYSIRLVENWMRKNDASVATYSRKDLNKKSMVSVVGGGISQRPAIDVGVWKASAVQNGNGKSSSSGILDSHSDKLSIIQLNNCLYDAPSQDLHLDMRIFDQVAELAQNKGTNYQFQRTLSSMLERKKVEKLSSRRKISITEASGFLHAKQRRRERTDLMSGGSSGPSTKTSLETVVNSSNGRTSFEHSLTHSVALNTSEFGECLENARAEFKMKEFSSTASSSIFSSQPPTNDLGSLVQHSPSAGEKGPEQGISHQVQTSASSNSTRPSAASFERIQNQALSSKDQLLKRHQRSKQPTQTEATRMKISSHKPTVPVPIGRPLSATGTKDTNQLRRDSRQGLAKPGASSAAVSRDSKMRASQSAKRVVAGTGELLKDDMPTKSTSTYVRYYQSRKYDTSDAAQSAIKRRIERRESVADNGNLAQDRREPEQPILTDRSKPQLVAGSFDPECIRPRSPNPLNRIQSQQRRKLGPRYPQSKPKEPEVSEAVKSSRRRRAERDSMPFNDRYRNEERKEAWASTVKESSVRAE